MKWKSLSKMKQEFKLVVNMKKFVLGLPLFLENFPKKQKVLKDRMLNTGFEILELIYYANTITDKEQEQKKIIAKYSMLDFYLEYAYKNKYITEKQMMRKAKELNALIKMTYGWIKNG